MFQPNTKLLPITKFLRKKNIKIEDTFSKLTILIDDFIEPFFFIIELERVRHSVATPLPHTDTKNCGLFEYLESYLRFSLPGLTLYKFVLNQSRFRTEKFMLKNK